MKNRFLIIIVLMLAHLAANVAIAGKLSAEDAESLRADVSRLVAATARGDAELVIAKTHPSVHKLVGGADAFAMLTRNAFSYLQQSGVKILSSEIGTPTQTYLAEDEEVTFVPRISIMEMRGKKSKSTTFMVAIRRVGAREWLYLDGAGLRNNPDVLYRFLPKLERGILFPLNVSEDL